MSLITAIEGDLTKVGSDIKTELEKIFGPGVDSFVTAAEALFKTEAGNIIKVAVSAAKTALPNGAGAVLHSVATSFAVPALKATGQTVSTQLLNLAIETVIGATGV